MERQVGRNCGGRSVMKVGGVTSSLAEGLVRWGGAASSVKNMYMPDIYIFFFSSYAKEC